ncbi:MAG: hypothetical protein P4L35_19030 [Ignavibacteriaceae bacterium]|nr:hypothetical protein [Ignavibacteriaceae bacterium]
MNWLKLRKEIGTDFAVMELNRKVTRFGKKRRQLLIVWVWGVIAWVGKVRQSEYRTDKRGISMVRAK